MKYEEKGCDEMRVAAEGGACTRAGVSVRRRLRVCRLLNEPGSLVVTWTEEVKVRTRRTLFAVVQFY